MNNRRNEIKVVDQATLHKYKVIRKHPDLPRYLDAFGIFKLDTIIDEGTYNERWDYMLIPRLRELINLLGNEKR